MMHTENVETAVMGNVVFSPLNYSAGGSITLQLIGAAVMLRNTS